MKNKNSILFHALKIRNEKNGYSMFTDKIKLKRLTLNIIFLLHSFVRSFLFYFIGFVLEYTNTRADVGVLFLFAIVWVISTIACV